MSDIFRPRGTGLRSSADRYDYERKQVLDPHYAGEIAMLKDSIRPGKPAFIDGGAVVRDRIKHLEYLAPYFDGVQMIKDTIYWPCRCALCCPTDNARKV